MGNDEEDEQLSRTFTRRALVLGGVQAAGFGIIAARLHQIQVRDETRYGALADTNRTSVQVVPPPRRGRIVDRSGQLLAGGAEAYRATFTPVLARDVERVIGLFARIVPKVAADVDRLVARARKQRANEPLILASDLTFDEIATINLLAPELPGVATQLAERRIYPQGRVMAHIVGHVGHRAEVAIDDDPMLRLPWMRAGASGIERGMDNRLAGRSGRVRLEVDARGRTVREVDRVEPVAGSDVVSTIDTPLQASVHAILSRERCAAAVVLDTVRGEVVAMVSVPGFDPAPIAEGVDPEAWRRMLVARDNPQLDRATAGQYPPGSTFKMLTALAALDAGVTDARQSIVCSGSYALGGQTYRCWNRGGHGRLDLVGAIRESCDVHFYELAQRLGIDRIARMGRRFGIGETFSCGLPLGRAGVMPDGDWKMGALGQRWFGGETLHAAIGQGYVLATPLQLAVMTARLATGREIVPTLLRPEASAGRPAARLLGIDDKWLELVRRGMSEVVNSSGGTGAAARLGESGVAPPGISMAGKTGTSQVARASSRYANSALPWELRDHALFVGYAPAQAPRYAVSVIIEHGGGGGAVAAPVARAIMAETLARDPLGRPALDMEQLVGREDTSTGEGRG